MLSEKDLLNFIAKFSDVSESDQPATEKSSDQHQGKSEPDDFKETSRSSDQRGRETSSDNFKETVEEMTAGHLLPAERQRQRPVKTGAHAKCFPQNSSDEISPRIFKHTNSIFLIIHQHTHPLRIEVKTDPKLAKLLISRHETVQQSASLGNTGIEIILTGQLPEDDILGLITHSYHMAKT
ncbi:MAG: hypothetical protein LBT19_00220 [Candidatus Nomurabacteria bacterium]|jgi:predicted DNA-binding protein (MmcQ/YjbR family)|nr:hypothetical protein [Candidatus Nomurabacteria bacterium]